MYSHMLARSRSADTVILKLMLLLDVVGVADVSGVGSGGHVDPMDSAWWTNPLYDAPWQAAAYLDTPSLL